MRERQVASVEQLSNSDLILGIQHPDVAVSLTTEATRQLLHSGTRRTTAKPLGESGLVKQTTLKHRYFVNKDKIKDIFVIEVTC